MVRKQIPGHNEACKIIFKIFKGLKEVGLINNFEKISSIDRDIYCFRIFLENYILRINFYKSSNLRDQVELLSSNLRTGTIYLGEKVVPKKILRVIKIFLEKYKKGEQTESSFLFEVKKMIEKSEFLSEIKVPTQEDNINKGIDFLIKHKENWIPIQVKSSLEGQENHKKKYKDIPSIVFQKNMKIFEKQIMLICDEYNNGRIIHL